MLTYAWHSLPEQPVFAVRKAVDLASNTVFTLGAAPADRDGLAQVRCGEHHREQQR